MPFYLQGQHYCHAFPESQFDREEPLVIQDSATANSLDDEASADPTTRANADAGFTIDTIEKEIVAAVKTTDIIYHQSTREVWGWAADLLLVFTYRHDQPWCNRSKHSAKPTRHTTRSEFLDTLKTLKKAGLLRTVSKQHSYNTHRLFISILVVLKEEKKLRVIANCKPTNGEYGRAPRVIFCNNWSMFHILAFFGPEAHFAISDFRHWFHQMGTPAAAAGNFTINVDGDHFYEFTTLPMGFAWAPYAAQGISMLIARIAINSLNHLTAIAPTNDTTTMPPFWIVGKKGSTWDTMTPADVSAFTIFWYDNLLIVAKSDKVRKSLIAAFLTTTKTYGAHWKITAAGAPTRASTTDPAAFTTSRGEVDYLGIHFEWKSGMQQYTWCHIAKNVQKWLTAVDAIEATTVAHRTWREAAQLAGILIWDWVLSREERRALDNEINVSQLIGGAHLRSRAAWDGSADIAEDVWATLILRFRNKLALGNRSHTAPLIPTPDNTINCASDACKKQGAGVDLRDNTDLPISWTPSQMGMHITRKETIAGLKTLLWILGKRQPNEGRRHVIIALDNTTAVTALNERIVYFEHEVDTLLLEVQRAYEEVGWTWKAIFIPGTQQPADRPSRLLKVCPVLCEQANMYIAQQQKEWYEKLPGWTTKRGREPDTTTGAL